MNARGLFAALRAIACIGGLALAAGSAGCMASPEEGEEEEARQEPEHEREEEEVEEPLDLTVDTLDVVHGSLRLIATMTDGAADVSIRLGGDCEHHEVGGGISTLSTLVWAFGEEDVAEALGCGLVVRARARDGDGFVSKIAALDVTVTATALDGTVTATALDGAEGTDPPNAEEGPTTQSAPPESAPALQGATAADDGIHLVFAPLSPGARLTTADTVIDATRSDPGDDDPAADGAGEFTLPHIDFARSILRNRALYVDGTPFVTSLCVAGVALDGSTVATEGADEGEVGAPVLTDTTIAQE
jgi:hypothetical protein